MFKKIIQGSSFRKKKCSHFNIIKMKQYFKVEEVVGLVLLELRTPNLPEAHRVPARSQDSFLLPPPPTSHRTHLYNTPSLCHVYSPRWRLGDTHSHPSGLPSPSIWDTPLLLYAVSALVRHFLCV